MQVKVDLCPTRAVRPLAPALEATVTGDEPELVPASPEAAKTSAPERPDVLPTRSPAQAAQAHDVQQQVCLHPGDARIKGGNQHAKWVECKLCGARVHYQSNYGRSGLR